LDQASQLQGCNLFLPLENLPPLAGNNFYFHEVDGFFVIDKHKGNIGKITQILDFPGNPLFEIKYENKQLLIPVRDEFIEQLDRENRTIYINAPEGLIDIYLNDDQEESE
jgi:16S rRNA processing protein RimM